MSEILDIKLACKVKIKNHRVIFSEENKFAINVKINPHHITMDVHLDDLWSMKLKNLGRYMKI